MGKAVVDIINRVWDHWVLWVFVFAMNATGLLFYSTMDDSVGYIVFFAVTTLCSVYSIVTSIRNRIE